MLRKFLPVILLTLGWVLLPLTLLLAGALPGLRGSRLFLGVALFTAVAGLAACILYLNRALQDLDQKSVVPDRVRAALDALADGLVILDTDENIVFANIWFARKLGRVQGPLIGKALGELGWRHVDDQGREVDKPMPWSDLLAGAVSATGGHTRLRCTGNRACTFVVNVAAIRSPSGEMQGVLATFNDVSELERENLDLSSALTQMEKSQLEITRRNRELQLLATRDPLTGMLNRRSLFEGLNQAFRDAMSSGDELSCLMIDIDHFKSINDRFGHSKGDKVIKLLADTLVESVRATDLVGRYGGEEFCVVLPGVELDRAREIAEQIRAAIVSGKDIRFIGTVRISASIGVSSLKFGAGTPADLIDQADKALYAAKQGGRNCVVAWPDMANADTGSAAALGVPGSAGYRVPVIPRSTNAADALLQENSDLQRRVTSLETLLREQSERASVDGDLMSLPTRSVLIDRITQGVKRGRRYETKLAVLCLEITTVQRVFETMGHSASERLVEGIAHRVRNTLRQSDTVALSDADNPVISFSRTGHGEFVVLIADLTDAESVTWIVRRLFEELASPIVLGGREVFLGYSAGISLYPADGDDPEALLSCAGAALSEVKLTQCPENFMYYCAEMNRRSREQLKLESRMHRAIEHDELYLEYQPRVQLATGRITGVEALLRWRNPELGNVPPGVFVPVAEHTGVIHEIGLWVVNTACQQLRAWHAIGYPDLSMSINLSPIQFRNKELARQIVDVAGRNNIPMRCLGVEITESVLMQNLDNAVDAIRVLHDAGARVALDDFGTGYSSLGYLKRLPIDEVKVDRAFLRDFPQDTKDATIVSAIIAMARALDLEVVAEGVESDAQLVALHRLQCDEVQGFLLSRPLSPEKTAEFLADGISVRRRVKALAIVARTGNLVVASQSDAADALDLTPACSAPQEPECR